MLKAAYCKYYLEFKQPAITSRAVMQNKLTYFIKVWDSDTPTIFGVGECALFEGLSYDNIPNYEEIIADICRNINNIDINHLNKYPSIVFGLETAIYDLNNGGKRTPFISTWSNGGETITINGLVWMGTIEEMNKRVDDKIAAGFKCLKLKIGGCDFHRELDILQRIRKKYPKETLEIRLDANGAFSPEEALAKIRDLHQFDIHSLEQPIKQNQWSEMAKICTDSPIPIALDEELIGITTQHEMRRMIREIKPNYIILKPALCGGFIGAHKWIEIANEFGIGWWATSALESNIGLNAIAQWVATLKVSIPQGLGTGALYTNNIASPLYLDGDKIRTDLSKKWDISNLIWINCE